MRTSLRNHLNDPAFSDVTFSVEGRTFHAHKIVLTLQSERFRAMFSSGMKESFDKQIDIPGMRYSIFATMMSFLYTGELELAHSDANDLQWMLELLRVADEFMLDYIKGVCERKLQDLVNAQNVRGLLEEADRCQAPNLVSYCEWYLRESGHCNPDKGGVLLQEEPRAYAPPK